MTSFFSITSLKKGDMRVVSLYIFEIFQSTFFKEHSCVTAPVKAFRSAISFKRYSDTDIFLWYVQNIQEHLFLQNTSSVCFSSVNEVLLVFLGKTKWCESVGYRLFLSGTKGLFQIARVRNFKSLWYIFSQKILTHTAQKMKFSIKNFSSECDQIHRTAELVTFTEEILNGKLHFLCSTSGFPQFLLEGFLNWKIKEN